LISRTLSLTVFLHETPEIVTASITLIRISGHDRQMQKRPGFLVLALALGAGAVGLAHYAPALPDSSIAPPSRQFGLPFAGNPGPNSWMFAQAYGNTTGGYRRRNTDYRAGQGIHFGLDFSAPCGTPVRAIGDGTVFEVDGPHGSGPHNLVLAHAGNLASLYGHLLRRSALRIGQRVKRGDVIGLSGDSQLTCISAPHLHLEIRDASHQRFFNPVLYLDADWNTLALAGSFGRGFQRDLDDPQRWQRLDDQPQARRGGRLLNDYARPWPPAPGGGSAPPWPSRIRAIPGAPTNPEMTLGLEPRRLTTGGCCANPSWSADSSRVLFIDRPQIGPLKAAPTAIYGVNPLEPGAPGVALSSVASLSPSERYALLPGPTSILERVSDGQRVRLPTESGNLAYSPSEARVAWSVSETRGNFDRLTTSVFTASLSSAASSLTVSGPKRTTTVYGGGVVGWLDEQRLVITGKSSPTERDRALRVLDVQSGQSRVLARALNFRSLNISPGGRWIAYTVAFDSTARNGLFVMDAQSGQARRVSWFGSYRWRDANRIVYVPLALRAPSHRLLEYDARTDQSRALVELGTKMANDQWQVSPDGQRLAFVNAADNNIYALELQK
jgi:murein DD-endopeptidase MepM/ murein hydrolase activator NlpD